MPVELSPPDAPPVRRVGVVRGRLELSPAGLARLDAEALGAARATCLVAAKTAGSRIPAAPAVQVTHAECALETDAQGVTVTVTVQAYAREPIDATALAALADTLLALYAVAAPAERDATGQVQAHISGLGVVQNVVL